MTTPILQAEASQRAASDPAVSAFVAANAGAGKTKLLIDRLLRLMLPGPERAPADPGGIVCLTYTKAAASEMAIRLQKVLGRWVTLPDDKLDAELARLDVPQGAETRRAARELFARVLDLPGGMRISTIHAFCQSLLRRFPLEARLSPHFDLLAEDEARVEMLGAREAALETADPAALAILAGLLSEQGFGDLVHKLREHEGRLAPVLALAPEARAAALRRAAGADVASEAELLARAVTWEAEAALRDALLVKRTKGTPAMRDDADRVLGWLNRPADLRAEAWAEWRGYFLTGSGEPRAPGGFCRSKTLAEQHPEIAERCVAEAARILAVEGQRRALRLAEATDALLALAGPVLRAYIARKALTARLDYADLIVHTSRLLHDPGVAWVLYKLDGGLDHLLLDEVQDTAPEQWRIAGMLTAEFFAGEGARETPRTLFAVGDRKQSIYSFQGAEPDELDRWRARFRKSAQEAGLPWREPRLDVSFRSTEPVLRLVDTVFRDPLAARGVLDNAGAPLAHIARREGHAGRVELWPLAPRHRPGEDDPWSIPRQNRVAVSAQQRLVEHLAAWIAARTDGGTLLESQGRPLAPGDVLVLLRKRGQFAHRLVRALKARGVPVAGLDRLVLTDQPAVQDLMALCDMLLQPQDDLTLANLLVSPLCDLSDESLMALALGREGTLWDVLRARSRERTDWERAYAFCATLLGRADYASPHALLAEALGPLGGRARLFRRLGPEAAEPVDEFLQAALTYAAQHPPSLQGFLHWMRQSGAEVKREAEGAGGAVRVMTVHGAKGLQAPLVILPDTTGLPTDDTRIVWEPDPLTGVKLPLWFPRKELRCPVADERKAEARRRQIEEYNRLLYVALTRAEDHLVVCGWEESRKGAAAESGEPEAPPESWYASVARGLARLDPERDAFVEAGTPLPAGSEAGDGAAADPAPEDPPDPPAETASDAGEGATPGGAVARGAWMGEILAIACPQTAAPPESAARAAEAAPDLPAWVGRAPFWSPAPPPPEPARPQPLAPSRPEGVALGTVPSAASPLAARGEDRFRRGALVHALLQHLPDLPEPEREEAAYAYAARAAHGLPAATARELAREALGVLADPALVPLFGPAARAEQPLSGMVGGMVVSGQVDRMAVLPDRVLVADFKTNRDPPPNVEETPPLYLRQMAAYRAVLRGLYPDRRIDCVLIWTTAPRVMTLPEALLDAQDLG